MVMMQYVIKMPHPSLRSKLHNKEEINWQLTFLADQTSMIEEKEEGLTLS